MITSETLTLNGAAKIYVTTRQRLAEWCNNNWIEHIVLPNGVKLVQPADMDKYFAKREVSK